MEFGFRMHNFYDVEKRLDSKYGRKIYLEGVKA